MRSKNLISSRVPPSSPVGDYNILVVGEAPGSEEAANGEPFIGKAGDLQKRYFERLGIKRSQIKYMNLCNYRPRENDFTHCLNTPELEEGLHEIRDAIKLQRPNVIVAFGNWPLFFITGHCGLTNNKPKPGTGIMSYRGSILSALDMFGGPTQKVIPTFHPSFVLRTWSWNPVFFHDLKRVVEDSAFPELNLPEYHEFIDPPQDTLYDLVSRAQKSDWISLDIETFKGGKYSCVGFAFKTKDSFPLQDAYVGVCVTYLRPDLARFSKEVWNCDTPKILQYGTYDASFMRHFYGWRLGGYYDSRGWDTYIASASLLPDFPRGLDFLASIHTRFPYYKTENKVWREMGDMNILWRYNIKDTVATHQIAEEQMSKIKELFKT